MKRHILTARETQVANLVAQGQSNAEIADSLEISRSTVKSLLSTIMIKWNCTNRTQVGVAVVRRATDADTSAENRSA